MGVAERKTASQAMAQQMKAAGTERIRGVCSICYGTVNIGYPQNGTSDMGVHMLKCKGPQKPLTGIRKGNNISDLNAVIERHRGKDNYRGLVYADLLGMGWSCKRISRLWDNLRITSRG